jgi:hypothetical protein
MFTPEKQSGFERHDKVDVLLTANADKINAEFREPLGQPPVLPDGRINMALFPDYDPAEVSRIEVKNSGIDDPDIRAFRLSKMAEKGLAVAGATDEDIIRFWKTENEKMPSSKWEKAAVVLLARRLGGDFLTMRSSLYDDYANKTDTVIVDKKSGAVICAIDLVNDQAGGDSDKKKMEQFKRDAKSGGNLRFGLTVEDGEGADAKKLVKKTLREVPKFFLSVERPDLDKLLRELPSDINAPITEIEKDLFAKLVASLNEQARQVLGDPRGLPGLKQNLAKFGAALKKMEEV